MCKRVIENVIDYIESNLSEKLDLNQLVHVGFTSKMQLYRDFYNITGHSVKEYVRKRRLSRALALVKHSDLSFSAIANSCGYGTLQAFYKCVKNTIGQTPLKYKQSDDYYYFPRHSSENKFQITVAAVTIPEVVCVRYYHSQLRGIENHAVGYFFSLIPGYNGRIFGRNGKQRGNLFCYELLLQYTSEVLNKLANSDFVDIVTLPAKTSIFAKTTVKNIENDINNAWDYLYTEWLKNSMFQQNDIPYFEEYIHKNGTVKMLELYLPIKRQTSYDKIKIIHCSEMYFLVSRKQGKFAESNASRELLDFLMKNDLQTKFIKDITKVFVSKQENEYYCGVSIDKEIELPQDCNLEILYFSGGPYAVLEGNLCGTAKVYENILSSWINDNALKKEDDVTFVLYDIGNKLKNVFFQTSTYIKIGSTINFVAH